VLQNERQVYINNVVRVIRERLGQTQWSEEEILRYVKMLKVLVYNKFTIQ
jgi:hypothetical protein